MNELFRFLKRYPGYNIILGMFIMVIAENLLSDVLGKFFGSIYALVFTSIVGGGIMIAAIIHYKLYKRKREKLPEFSQPIEKKYEGLIVATSIVRDKSKDEIIKDIDSIKDIRDKRLGELYNIIGMGHIIKAIVYHSKMLKVIWLLYTYQSQKEKDVIRHFVRKFFPMIKIREVLLENPNEIKSVYEEIDRILVKETEEYGLKEKNVVLDISAGTRATVSAMALIRRPPKEEDIHIEYMEQDTYQIIEV